MLGNWVDFENGNFLCYLHFAAGRRRVIRSISHFVCGVSAEEPKVVTDVVLCLLRRDNSLRSQVKGVRHTFVTLV